jgi:pectinesterase
VRITASVLTSLALIAPAWAAQPAAGPIRVVVAADGTGDFKTIQRAVDHALDHAPILGPTERLIIEIRPGVYCERVRVPPDRPRVTFLGKDAASTVITANMSAAAAGGTFFSAATDVSGAQFEAENITFENSFGAGSQAVAISVHSDRAIFRNCRFLGWQDTLYAASGRQYYKDCYIEGHVDFIFGNSAAVFDHCEIHSRGPGYIAAVSRTTPDMPAGFVFRECKLTGENTGKGVFLGRPWRSYARVVFLGCWMGDHIRPEGWDNWGNPGNEKTAWFGERGSAGPGAEAAKRIPWAHSMSAAEASPFATGVFLRGADGWNPASR